VGNVEKQREKRMRSRGGSGGKKRNWQVNRRGKGERKEGQRGRIKSKKNLGNNIEPLLKKRLKEYEGEKVPKNI